VFGWLLAGAVIGTSVAFVIHRLMWRWRESILAAEGEGS